MVSEETSPTADGCEHGQWVQNGTLGVPRQAASMTEHVQRVKQHNQIDWKIQFGSILVERSNFCQFQPENRAWVELDWKPWFRLILGKTPMSGKSDGQIRILYILTEASSFGMFSLKTLVLVNFGRKFWFWSFFVEKSGLSWFWLQNTVSVDVGRNPIVVKFGWKIQVSDRFGTLKTSSQSATMRFFYTFSFVSFALYIWFRLKNLIFISGQKPWCAAHYYSYKGKIQPQRGRLGHPFIVWFKENQYTTLSFCPCMLVLSRSPPSPHASYPLSRRLVVPTMKQQG